MPKFKVYHITTYQYPTNVTDSANQIVLYPYSTEFQKVSNHKITLKPNANIDTYEDYFGNKIGVFTISEPHQQLDIVSEFDVETFAIHLPVLNLNAEEQWQYLYENQFEATFLDFLKSEEIHQKDEILSTLNQLFDTKLSIMETTTIISEFIYKNFTYKQGVTTFETKIDEIWQLKAGVCQDFAHLLLEMLRLINIPARYVSGYISPSNQELRGEGATHAWVEVYIPDYGWLGNDPTNNTWVSDRHIKMAIGRDFNDCTPVKGTYKGTSDHTLSVSVIITNENTKDKTALPAKPVYVRQAENKNEITNNHHNSYREFLEMQQQQQQQQ